MNKTIRYSFVYKDKCNMCGSATDTHTILGKRLNRSQGLNPKNKIGISTTIVQCTNCGLIYSNPQPVPFKIEDHYGILPQEYWPEDFFKTDTSFFAEKIRILKTFLNPEKKARALEVGSGLGRCLIALSKEEFEIYGLEPSKPFYNYSIEKIKINPDQLKCESIEEAEYPENYFDFILFNAVLEHLYDPSASIIKAVKWLKPNGIIHIEVPSSNWLTNKIYNFYYFIRGLDYVGNISPMHPPFHLYEFGLTSFTEHAKQNNYEIVFFEYHVCSTYMPKILDFILVPLMKWTRRGMQLHVWLRKK